ncbi:MAG: hypothetical protein HZA83_03085 [Thaumarchaeota archaeon]|nr:hypothetical protein [Nitrososphaerota archaeon]
MPSYGLSEDTMEPLIHEAGSTMGAFSTMIMNKGRSNDNTKLIRNNTFPNSVDLQKRVVTAAMNRIYDYERQGKITSIEREKLLAKYRQELNMLDNKMHGVTLYDPREIGAFGENLVAVVDQRMAQINAKLDDLASKIGSNAIAQSKFVGRVERKEEKHVETQIQTPKPLEPIEIAESTESENAESDASLDDIKKQIMQTLSRLEQAEVE